MYLLLFLRFFSLIINENISEGCNYTNLSNIILRTDKNYLKDVLNETEAKLKCFSLSNSFVHSGKCCLKNNSINERSGYECSNNNYNDICPKDPKILSNCGINGIYQPENSSVCTEISLVKGYCCFVKFEKYGSACIRTKYLEKNKNSITDDIKKFANKQKTDAEIESVICIGYLEKYSYLLIIFLLFYIN